jgi:SAM-dependent methyltransferase
MVLEAGGGSVEHLLFPEGSKFTVVDISAEQLADNTYADETIQEDLHTFRFESNRFDVVVFNDVLEHLYNPRRVLDRCLDSLKPGGAVVFGGPVISSVKGLVTKFTPHWFHVLIYRVVFKNPAAGQPGSPPFPTYARWLIDPRHLRRYLENAGMQVVHFELFESEMIESLRQRSEGLYRIYRACEFTLHFCTGGWLTTKATDFQLVAIKRAHEITS